VSASAAAVYVITNDDLRRSGATTLAEAMRLAPGMQVSRVNGHVWALSARGFADNIYANKLLVLMDGRTLYNPASAGVEWELQNTLFEDIERIEVIRGPGAALWGSNAVNGVINIITKESKDTQGGLVTVTGGNEEHGSASVRYGGRINKALAIRGYAKFENRDDQALANGDDAFDETKSGQAGFRMDWDATRENIFTLQGDAYYGQVGNSGDVVRRADTAFLKYVDDERISGANILGRWTHTFNETSSMQFQAFYDRLVQTDRKADELRDTYDFDFQHNLSVGDRHEIVWGAGYRLVSDFFEKGDFVSYDPAHRVLNTANGFAQDSITLLPEKVKLSLGMKLEFNDLSGFEYQPDLRFTWTPTPWQSVWMSFARAVRTPARLDHDVVANLPAAPPGALGQGAPGVVALLKGDSNFESEKLYSIDAGYRVQPHKKVSIDLAAFYYTYKDIRSLELGAPFNETAPDRTVIPAGVGNQLDARSYGGEAVISGQATEWWRLQAQYSFMRRQYTGNTSSDPATSNGETGRHPRHQAALRSFMNLPHNVELDLTLRFVDELSEIDVPAYLEGDIRVGWRPADRFEFSLVGQNLFDSHHPEWVSEFAVDRTEVQRSVFLKFTMKF